MIGCYDLIKIFHLHGTTLTQEEIDQLVARLFDKDPPTPRPASMPTPFSSENPPPVVRPSSFTNATIFIADKSVLLMTLGVLS
jgi:hypothetical protein